MGKETKGYRSRQNMIEEVGTLGTVTWPVKALKELQAAGERYARSLRVVGQDLAPLYPDIIEIENHDGDLIARVRTRVSLEPDQRPGSGLENFSHKSSDSSFKATINEFERTYTQEVIDKLDEIGTAQRSGAVPKPDLYSIAEKLRMVGRILDEEGSELLNVCHDGRRVIFQYRDKAGLMHIEEYSHLAMYKLQEKYYSGRAVDYKDAWKNCKDAWKRGRR